MKTRNKVLIGLAIAAIVYSSNQRKKEKPPVYATKLLKKYNAVTIPPIGVFIKESEKDNEALLNHEAIHWKQYREKGLIQFYSQYNSELNKYGYDKMPMEMEARANESEMVKKNYTAAVRNGTAKTVYNPEFRMGLQGQGNPNFSGIVGLL